MPEQLILDRGLATNGWSVFRLEEGADLATVPLPAGEPSHSWLVPASLWLARRAELKGLVQAGMRIGLSVPPAFRIEEIAEDLPDFPLIAVEFPKFADGRGYSTARLLRERYRYQGELRAVGDVGRDQLFYLSRVGFNAFLFPDGRDAAAAIAAFGDFPEVYQAATDQKLPLFRRRPLQAVNA